MQRCRKLMLYQEGVRYVSFTNLYQEDVSLSLTRQRTAHKSIMDFLGDQSDDE